MAESAASPMATAAPSRPKGIRAIQVPEHLRTGFLARVFGAQRFGEAEAYLFQTMHQLCPEYLGGRWHFYDLSNGSFYMAPEDCVSEGQQPSTWLLQASRGLVLSVSLDAAGIVATLFTQMAMFWEGEDDMVHAYDRLRDFALEHPERRAILRAIG